MEQSQFKSLSEWNKSSKSAHSAYNTAHTKGLIPIICKKFGWSLPKKRKANKYWNEKTCKKSALKYNTISEWKNNFEGGYDYAIRNNLIDICTKHMIKHTCNWTLDKCKLEALKYKSKTEWVNGNIASFTYAMRRNWLNECCKHMIQLRSPKRCWNKELCIIEALKYKSKGEWNKYSRSSFRVAYAKGWLNECCEHMGYINRKTRINEK